MLGMRSRPITRRAVAGLSFALIAGLNVAACGSSAPSAGPSRAIGASSSASAAASADPATDKLAQVQSRGTLVLWTDPDYAPQSFAVKGATRLAATKCAPNQLTAPELSGYDAETGKLVAAALGIEPCFVATPFDAMIAGSWGDRWDVAWGSGAITFERMERLYVTQPYYSTPANFFVQAGSPFREPADLSGKRIGACAGCTHERYLQRTLELPGETVDYVVDAPTIVTFNSEVPGLQAVEAGEVDAFLCSETVGLAAIDKGATLEEIATAAYFTHKTGYVDRDLALAPGPFLAAVDGAIADLHASGKLKELSVEFFKKDYSAPAAAFDLAALDQQMP
jgi:polar amino acid transport system substrate-binding protein